VSGQREEDAGARDAGEISRANIFEKGSRVRNQGKKKAEMREKEREDQGLLKITAANETSRLQTYRKISIEGPNDHLSGREGLEGKQGGEVFGSTVKEAGKNRRKFRNQYDVSLKKNSKIRLPAAKLYPH